MKCYSVSLVIIFFFIGTVSSAFGSELWPPPVRWLTYQTESRLVRGRAEVKYQYGLLRRIAKNLPYENTDTEARRHYKENMNRKLLKVSTKLQVRFMADYYMEAYLKPGSLRPVRAVRWKDGFPDVFFDFPEPRYIWMTHAKQVSEGVFKRFGNWVSGGDDENEADFEINGPHRLDVGERLVDLMTVFAQIEKRFTADGEPPDDVFYHVAIKKSMSSVYVARFEPVKRQTISLQVNDEKIKRPALKCRASLQYGAAVVPEAGDSVRSLAAEYLPDKPLKEAQEIVKYFLEGRKMEDWIGEPLILPVSIEVYNRIYEEDEEFEGPFGLSETVYTWFDAELGIPLRVESELYGFNNAVVLTDVDEGYFQFLTPKGSK